MNKNYSNYTVDQLLRDDYFIETTFIPTKNSNAFWTDQIELGLHQEVFYKAQSILLADTPSHELKKESLFANIKWTIRRKSMVRWTKYASAAILLLALTFFYFHYKQTQTFVETTTTIAQQLKDTSEIVLLSDNSNSTLIEGKKATLDFSNDEKVIVNRNMKLDIDAQKVEMHQIIVPHGKQIYLILPDQTKLWVNAGTTVKFPSAFVENKREIYVNGEVYGDVTTDKKKPFVFKTKTFDVQVLGTSLNVNAYETSDRARVTLVEGKVKVKSGQGDLLLTPNQSFVQNNDASRKETVEVKYYTSWKDGYYHFKNEKLVNVLEDLARFYGKKIDCDPAVANKLCSGNLSLDQNLNDVLEGIAFTVKLKLKQQNNTYIFQSN